MMRRRVGRLFTYPHEALVCARHHSLSHALGRVGRDSGGGVHLWVTPAETRGKGTADERSAVSFLSLSATE
jgi:hypothetical protein